MRQHFEILLIATLLTTMAHSQIVAQSLGVVANVGLYDKISDPLGNSKSNAGDRSDSSDLPFSVIEVQFGPEGKLQCFAQGERRLLEGWNHLLVAKLEGFETTGQCRFRVGSNAVAVNTGDALEIGVGGQAEKFHIVDCSRASRHICLILER